MQHGMMSLESFKHFTLVGFDHVQAVFKDAEKMAKAYREAHTVQENHQVEDFPDRDAKMVIANWDWLEFGGNCEPRG